MSFRPKTRLEKILRRQDMKARSALEESVQIAMQNAGGGGVFESNASLSEDSETGKTAITTDKTAVELFDAVNAGKSVRALASITSIKEGEEPVTVMITKVLHVAGVKFVHDGVTSFEFNFVDIDEEDGIIGFIADSLSADDIVVFRQV